jgi:hypothetical protein
MITTQFFKRLSRNPFSMIAVLAFSGWSAVDAQTVSYYSFSQNQGTYTPLSGSTNIATATASTGSGVLDDNVYTLDNAIPFAFPFNGNSFNSVKVHANGFISFGSTATSSTDPIGSGVSYEGVISPLAADLESLYNINNLTGSIDYAVVGSAPNREFVVQWSHFRPYASFPATASSHHDWNFQARLHENGSIQYVYGLNFQGSPSATNAKTGLRGTTSSDYINRTASGNAGSNWNNTIAGTYSSAGIATNYNFLPSQGLTFNWTAPSACTEPASQPSNLALTNSGIIINGSFTPASPAADRYLVLRNPQGSTPNAPVNGTTYTTGNNTSLNSYVAYYGPNTSFENNYNHGIRGNNQYTYTVYAVNSNCTGGPLYNVQNPLTASVTNCPITVNSITTSNAATDSFDISWPAPENGNALPVNTVIEVASDTNFNTMVAGSPFTLNSTDLSIHISGLQPNTQYFIRGKSVTSQCESSYSSPSSIYTTCTPVSSFYENFDTVTGNTIPNCWSKILTSSNSSTPTINVTTTEANSSPNNISFYGNGASTSDEDTKIILVSPELTNISAGTHRLRFKAKRTSADTQLQVVALTGNTASAGLEIIETVPLTTTYDEYIVYVNNYTGSANHLGIRRIDGGTWSYMYVDDVIWETVPTCPELATVTKGTETYNGAHISWTNANNQEPASGYEYFVSTLNTPPAETNTFIPLASGTASTDISGLSNGTYYFWIRRICSPGEKSPWKSVSFTTIPTATAPWKEEFMTSSYPAGWSYGSGSQSFSLGTTRGATGNGASNTNLYKNLFSSAPSATFSTINVGPLNAADYELSFYYKQSNFNAPYTPLTDWGNFEVQISSDFGTSWTTIGTVDNEAGTGGYIKKTYSLAAYQNQFVKVRINASRTAGDYDLSFDNFEIRTADALSTLETVKEKIKIYPNPADSYIKIDAKEKVKSFELYTLSGQLVKKGGQVQEISLEGTASGLYILKIILDNGESLIHKVIKK